jgi:hypothetical protein
MTSPSTAFSRVLGRLMEGIMILDRMALEA